jgi:hypothetical protein
MAVLTPLVDRVHRGERLDPRGDLARGADGDWRDVEHNRIDIDERPVADLDRPAVAREGRTHDGADVS